MSVLSGNQHHVFLTAHPSAKFSQSFIFREAVLNIEHINRRTWRNVLDRRYYRKSAGYINKGEERLLDLARTRIAHPRILDIGVGGGRTTPLLLPGSSGYLGIDYTEEMVRMARTKHPDVPFKTMDAREVMGLADGRFDRAVFSYNGIDSVDGDGRLRVLGEVSRVLRSGGQFAFSTFNRDWTGFGDKPAKANIAWTAHPVRLTFRVAMHLFGAIRARRRRQYEERGEEHAIFLHPAHDYGILVYATTLPQLTEHLAASASAPNCSSSHPMERRSNGHFRQISSVATSWPPRSDGLPSANNRLTEKASGEARSAFVNETAPPACPRGTSCGAD